MRDRVSVGVAGQTFGIGDFDAAEDQLSARGEGV
jgi:hypothetical protein